MKYAPITKEEFHQLKPGDVVYVRIEGEFYRSTVKGFPTKNSECEWELETSNGWCDCDSLWTSLTDKVIDQKNVQLLDGLFASQQIIAGLSDGTVPITVNNLVHFCEENKIDLNAPILIECPDGYFPLTHYHNAIVREGQDNKKTINLLALTDGNW